MNNSFQLVKKLGSGVFGDVYLGKTPESRSYYFSHPYVAVKIIKKSKNHLDAKHEAKLLSTLKHDTIVEYLDMLLDKKQNNICLVMEYCEYGTLKDWIQVNRTKNDGVFDDGYLKEKVAWGIFWHLSSALRYLHNLNPPIIHRDLKPDNILSKKGKHDGKQRLKIGDFGFAKALGQQKNLWTNQDLYYTRSQAGTEIYIAPEVVNGGRVTTSSDIFSLGAVISFACNRGMSLFHDCNEISTWKGNQSTLHRGKYSQAFRQMTSSMFPVAQIRPDAKLLAKITSYNYFHPKGKDNLDIENTWESKENCDCNEPIKEYENNNADQKSIDSELKSLSSPTPSSCKVNSNQLYTGVRVTSCLSKTCGFGRGLEPEQIVGSTQSLGEHMFIIKWKGRIGFEAVTAREANIKCPQTVIKFYEKRSMGHVFGDEVSLEDVKPES